MTKRSRAILFLACLFLFALAAPLVILYNQGYRFDFSDRTISQTGGFYIKVSPKQADIYLNDKLVKRTDFFFGSILIENLLPERYKIEIKKQGFLPWKKTLEIKKRNVTEAKNIILFPEKADFQILTKNVKKFWFSPDQSKIILREESNEGWSLKLYALDSNIKSHLISRKDISTRADLIDLEFPDDSSLINLKISLAENLRYFSLNLNQSPYRLTEIDPPAPSSEDIITHQRIANDIYYLDKFGTAYRTNVDFTQKQKINNAAIKVENETEYKLKIFPDEIFLKENRKIYRLNNISRSFEPFSDNVKDLKISPDFKKIAYFTDSEIWILYLKDSDPDKKAGDNNFLTRFSEKVDNVFWLGSNHLIFNSGNTIKTIEIDDRDNINTADLAQYNNPQIFWSQRDKTAFIQSEDNLYRSNKIID